MNKTNLLKCEKNVNLNQHVISCLFKNPAECKSLLNIMPLDSRVKPENDKEVGRSMVEMLGVLAVMGVLSVAGIAGYNNAMNKHRANELLNESSKRAVVIATQILSGKSVSSDMINQFDNNGTTFTGVEEVGTNQFKLTLSGVDDDVCTQLKATVGSNTIIQEVGDKCAYLTFNNDLSKGSTSSNTGGSTGGSSQQEPVVDLCADVICQNGGKCSGGTCDCTGTGYTGDHCETQLKSFMCLHGSFSDVYDPMKLVGNCLPHSCKITDTWVPAKTWVELCTDFTEEETEYFYCSDGDLYSTKSDVPYGHCDRGCNIGHGLETDKNPLLCSTYIEPSDDDDSSSDDDSGSGASGDGAVPL